LKKLSTYLLKPKNETKHSEKRRQNHIDLWLSLPKPEIEPERREVFQILEGEEQISLKADEILGKAGKEVSAFISENDIANFYHSGLLDKLEKASRKGVNVQLLTNYSPKTCFFVEKTKLKKAKYSKMNAEDIPTFIIADNEQLLLLIRKENGKKKVAALWTNYDAFIKTMKTLFNELWNNND